MGQYHFVANLDKQEFLHPHQLGDGLKLMEFGASGEGTMLGLALLLAVSNGRGGGDYHEPDELTPDDAALIAAVIGRWGGDRIAIIGDYAEDGDLPDFSADDPECSPWADEDNTYWTNISASVRRVLELERWIEVRRSWGELTGDPYDLI